MVHSALSEYDFINWLLNVVSVRPVESEVSEAGALTIQKRLPRAGQVAKTPVQTRPKMLKYTLLVWSALFSKRFEIYFCDDTVASAVVNMEQS